MDVKSETAACEGWDRVGGGGGGGVDGGVVVEEGGGDLLEPALFSPFFFLKAQT